MCFSIKCLCSSKNVPQAPTMFQVLGCSSEQGRQKSLLSWNIQKVSKCVPQMVLSTKGKNRVKRARTGHGKIRSSPCSFNWGFTRAALRRWHMGKEPQEARRWTRWPCGEHARRKEERQMGRTVPWESENHIGALGRERRRDEGKASGR